MKTNPFHQTVIVTGGATGHRLRGRGTVCRAWANVLLNGRTRAKLAGAAEKLGNSDRVAFIAADITQPANAQIYRRRRARALRPPGCAGEQCRHLLQQAVHRLRAELLG